MKKYLKIISLTLPLYGCCSYVITSEWEIYQGKITMDSGSVDTNISIYFNYDGRHVFQNGQIAQNLSAVHPDTSGYFIVASTSPQHDKCQDEPNQWNSGPSEIYITGSLINDTTKTYSIEELKAFQKIDPLQIGYKMSRYDRGIWKIPEIIIRKK